MFGRIFYAQSSCDLKRNRRDRGSLRLRPVFLPGEGYEFSLGASSSAAIVASDDAFAKLTLANVRGESVRYRGDRRGELLSRFRARVLFTEVACGVTNYYCYSPFLDDSVELSGELVNLHIAVGNGQTAAGTPLIFGGF